MDELEFLEKTAPIDILMGADSVECINLPAVYQKYRRLADAYMADSENRPAPAELGEAWEEIKSALDECLYDLQQAEKRWEKI